MHHRWSWECTCDDHHGQSGICNMSSESRQYCWSNLKRVTLEIQGTRAPTTDQGRSFESAVISESCKLYRVKKTCTRPHHPEGNPQRERFNQTLHDLLHTLPPEQKWRWPEHLQGHTTLRHWVQTLLLTLRSKPPRTSCDCSVVHQESHLRVCVEQRAVERVAQQQEKVHYPPVDIMQLVSLSAKAKTTCSLS